jgi:UDP-N-acetylglucosamine acyltransferase
MIHKTAIVDPKAKISANVNIGPYSIIGPNVEIGEDTDINSHVSIAGYTKIGKKNKIYPFASIGNNPQDLKYKGEKSSLEIGNGNTIREYVSINPGTDGGGGLTKIGNNCLFMVSSHVAHDCVIGDNVVAVNNVAIGGHVQIDDNAIIGGNSAVHQFIRIGKFAMIGGMCAVIRDVIPYGLVHGNRSVLQGINLIGLRRNNISNQDITLLSNAYKEIFKSENLSENLKDLSEDFKNE